MNLFKTTIFIAIITIFTGCKKAFPDACFHYTTTPTSYDTDGYPMFPINTEIDFDASCTTNATGYKWEFGDDKKTKTSKNPSTSHSYSKEGVYTVKLTAKNKMGYKVAIMKIIVTP